MAKIELKNVKKSYGAVDVIKGIDLTIEKGEFMVFVGPSGCGKSTLLRLISGLEEISSGDMLFDGERVNNVLPSQRGIAMVFQSYALYPHMTVYAIWLARRRKSSAPCWKPTCRRFRRFMTMRISRPRLRSFRSGKTCS